MASAGHLYTHDASEADIVMLIVTRNTDPHQVEALVQSIGSTQRLVGIIAVLGRFEIDDFAA